VNQLNYTVREDLTISNRYNNKNRNSNYMGRKLTTNEWIQKVIERFPENTKKYDYSLVKYELTSKKVKIVCVKHGIFEQTPEKHLSGRGCIKCRNSGFALSSERWIKRAKERHSDTYEYNLVEYVNAKTKVKIICPKHGIFEQTPDNHLRGGNGCPKCADNYKLNTKEWVKKAKNIHGERYGYDQVIYEKATKKVKIKCFKHGIFEQTPSLHLNTSGCSKCSGKHSPNTEEWIKKAKGIHGEKYGYDLVEYSTAISKVKIECLESNHGIFEQTASSHIRGYGCPKCAGKHSPNTEEWIKKAKGIHGEKYGYDYVDYVGAHTPVKIECFLHGFFDQTPHNHLQGKGCSGCAPSGFQSNLSAYYYVHEVIDITNNEILYYKGGISNNWKNRLGQLRRGLPDGLILRNIEILYFDSGVDALKLETKLLRIQEIRAPNHSFGGGSELFLFNPLNYARDNNILNY